MILLRAQHQDFSILGFYFTTADEFENRIETVTEHCRDIVEEFEIRVVYANAIDCELANVIGINQRNLRDYLACIDDWQDWQKTKAIIAIGECGYEFHAQANPDHYEIDIYYFNTLSELAEHFVEEGLYGDIPASLQYCIDYDAIAYDLRADYCEAIVAGDCIIYRAS